MLGKVNVVTQFIEACRTSINKHEEVRKNRYTVKNNCIKLCG
jgi:hypothetical protein